MAYGLGENKISEAYAYIMPRKTYVNLGFLHSASLVSMHTGLEGTGAKLKHIKVRTLKSASSPEIRQVLLEAMAERMAALGLGVSDLT